MCTKYLKKFRTSEKGAVSFEFGNGKTFTRDVPLYKIDLVDFILLIFELKIKKKFYKSIIGKLFFNGDYNIIDVEYTLKLLQEKKLLEFKFNVI